MPVDQCTEGEGADRTGGDDELAVRRNLALAREIAERDRALTGGWRLDLSTETFWWSPEVYEMLGVQAERFTPTFANLAALLDSHTAARLESRRRCMRRDGEPFAEGYWVTRPDGARKLLDVRGWSVGAARPGGEMFGTCRDVTDAAQMRSERERLHRRQASILSAAGDGICGLDLDGRITFVNPALRRLMWRHDEELIDARLHDLVHRDARGDEVHPGAECPFHAPGQRPATAVDPTFHRSDGSRIEVGYMLVDLDDGCARGAVVSFRDITARRAAARLLQTSLRDVQTLSAQRGALLGHLAEAEERERLRIASHIHDDTIQALGAVALRLSNAGERVAGNAERDVLVDAELDVRGVAERLRGLMFELMPPDRSLDLRAAVETYCSVLFAHSGIAYELVGDVGGLRGDGAVAAYRLIQEALRNARTHSHGTRVQVTFEDSAGEFVFRISDDGVGMGDHATPPTHAGLRIVRQRAEAAGGGAEFGPGLDGRGSAIVLRLPLPQRAPA